MRPALPLMTIFCIGGIACHAPVPREIEITLDIAPEVVRLQGRLSDLLIESDDPIDQFFVMGAIATPEAIRDVLTDSGAHPYWLRRPVRYAFAERAGRLDLSLAAEASRADFERCLGLACSARDPASPAEKAAHEALEQQCLLFPLKRCGAGYEAALSGYHPAPGAAASFPATARRLTLRLVADGLDSAYPALAAHRLYEGDVAGALRARAWIVAYGRALAARDLRRVRELDGEVQGHLPHLRTVLQGYRQRVRSLLLQRVLWAFDREHLGRQAEVPGLRAEELDGLLPRRAPPRPALWGLRLLYELSQRVPATFDRRRDEVCREPILARAPGYGGLCEVLGAR